jgi:hypothetical protein
MYIRLARKLADVLNEFDLRPFKVGEVIDMKESLALMLLRAGWAQPASMSIEGLACAQDGCGKPICRLGALNIQGLDSPRHPARHFDQRLR